MRKTGRKGVSALLAGVLVLALLAGCGGEKGPESPATTSEVNSPAASPSIEPETEQSGWYELDGEMGILTVWIPDEMPGFEWNFLIGDSSVLELLTQETTKDGYVASFRALADGESQITFSYVRNDARNEARVLKVRCAGGKVAEITAAGYSVYLDFTYTASKTGQQVRVIDEKSFVGDTATSCVQGRRDGKQVQDINRTVTYKPGTTAPRTVPDEGANVAGFSDALKMAK